MKKVLITGASGFVGSHLCELLANTDFQVYGTVFGNGKEVISKWVTRENMFEVNLLDKEKVEVLVDKIRPNYVVHLAALSSPKASFSDQGETLNNNLMAELFLLEGLKKCDYEIDKIILITSAEIYGKIDETNLPINEECPLNPLSPYAVSKIAQDYLGLQYFLSESMPIVRLRPANHTGERQSPAFVVPAFAKQIAEIESGLKPPVLEVGNLEATRDFTDVKDIVRAYAVALEKAEPGEEYNLGTGKGVVIKELLDKLLSLSKEEISVTQDETRLIPSDIPKIVINASKFETTTGWQPEIDIQDTLERVLNYWRDQVNSIS
jgi:GDP-4-dehydro-6-deoxy-D-mannose reductase